MEQVIIVIPCSGWNDYVRECLLACIRVDYPSLRIVLLPDEPLVLPKDVADKRIQISPTGRITIGMKRNRALQAFPGAGYFAFLDSDAYPDPAWLRNGIAAFGRDVSIVAVGGPNLTPPDEPDRQRIVGNALRSFLVSGGLTFAKTRSAGRYCASLHACNLIVAAAPFAAAGGFDEELRTGEDRVLCHRLRTQGGKIYFSGDTVVFHHNRLPGLHLFRQRFVHGHSIYHIAVKDPDLHNLPLFIPPAAAIAVLGGLLIGFVHHGGWLAAGGLVGAYLAASAAESFRISDRTGEVLPALAAILTANLGYIAGSMLGLLDRDRDLMDLYDNWNSSVQGRRLRESDERQRMS